MAGSFSWRRLGLHLSWVIVGAAVAALATLAIEGLDRVAVGRFLGKLTAQAVVVGALVSWLAQTGRRAAAAVCGVGTALLVVVILLVGFARARAEREARRVTAAERRALVMARADERHWLRHPELGFRVLHPGPSFEAVPSRGVPAVGFPHAERAHRWVYEDRGTGESFVVFLAKGVERREDAQALVAGLAASVREAGLTRVVEEGVRWDGAERELGLHATSSEDIHLFLRGRGVRGADGVTYLVAASLTTFDAAHARRIVESLELGGRPRASGSEELTP